MTTGKELEYRTRQAMAAAGVRSVSALARQAGVERDTLYAWWRGEREPKPETLRRVAETLRVPLGTLWDYLEEEAEPAGDTAAVVTALVDELRRWRTEDRDRLAQLEAMVALLAGSLLDERERPAPRVPRTPRATRG